MLAILNSEEKEVVKMLRAMPDKAKKILMKKIEEIREEMEDAQDLRDARERMKELSIPFDEAMKQIGL